MDRASQVCPSFTKSIITLYDIRDANTVERLCRELAGWRGFANVELLDDDCATLIMWPGGARRLAP